MRDRVRYSERSSAPKTGLAIVANYDVFENAELSRPCYKIRTSSNLARDLHQLLMYGAQHPAERNSSRASEPDDPQFRQAFAAPASRPPNLRSGRLACPASSRIDQTQTSDSGLGHCAQSQFVGVTFSSFVCGGTGHVPKTIPEAGKAAVCAGTPRSLCPECERGHDDGWL